MYWTYLKTIAFVLILGAFFGGGYLVYRSYTSTSSGVANYLSHGTPLAATTCPFKGSSFEGAVDGALFIDGVKLRADWNMAIRGIVRKAHAVSLDGKTFYTWNDQSDVAYTTTVEEFLRDFIFLGLTDGTCQPWWSPDASMFVVPDTLEFAAYNG